MLTKVLFLTLALAADLLPGERPSYQVRDFVLPEDCSQSICDLSPAFSRLFAITDAVPALAGLRQPGALIELPPGEFKISRPIILDREHTLRGAGGSGWGPPTLIRVTTSTHGIVVNTMGAWADIGGFALITSVPSGVADRHAILLKARAHVHDMFIRGFTVGVYCLGGVAYGTNCNGTKLDFLRMDNQEFAGVYLLGDNAGAVELSSVDVGSGCKKAIKWSPMFQNRPCAGVMDYSMMGAVIVAGQSANARDEGGQYFGNYYLRRTAAIGLYSENVPAPGVNTLEVDAIALGGIGTYSGPGFRLYGPRASQIRAYGTAAVGDTQRPEIWIGGDAQPAGTVLTLMPPQSGSTFPSYSALRTKMDTTAGKRGWRTDLQNAAQYTTERILIEPTKPGVVVTRTSTKVIP